MTIVTINREPSWGDLAVGAVVNLPPALADPLIASGEAVPTPNATPTQVWSGSTVSSGGATYLTLPDGSTMPLAPVVGTGYSPLIGGNPLKAVLIDEGSDATHAKLLYTFNCYGGDPDTSDVALMSARFNAASTSEEVVDLNISGGAAGAIVIHGPASGYITMIHLAREDSGTYTEAAGATVTARQAVFARWPSEQLIRSVMLYIGESYVGAGSNQRYREITVVGFTAS